jgi:hypothetical protein
MILVFRCCLLDFHESEMHAGDEFAKGACTEKKRTTKGELV